MRSRQLVDAKGELNPLALTNSESAIIIVFLQVEISRSIKSQCSRFG